MTAAQVFAIPELLENIILQVALEAVATSSRDMLEPITSLARLHCIDRTFNATIKGSHKLQLAMFSCSDHLSYSAICSRLGKELSGAGNNHTSLVAADATFEKRHRVLQSTTRCSPLEWLWKSLGTRHPRPDRVLLDIHEQPRSTQVQRLASFLASRAGSPVASWRQVKVLQSDAAEERLSLAVMYFRRPKEYKGTAIYFEKFAFEDGATLGEIFDNYMEILSRKATQHAEFEELFIRRTGDRIDGRV